MLPSFEKFMATRLPSLASRGICLKKHDLALQFLLEGFIQHARAVEERHGEKSREILWRTQKDLGFRIGTRIKNDYHLGDDLDAAVDLMWMCIIPFGIRMKTTRLETWRVREEKTRCPIYDTFAEAGVNYCHELCLAMTSGWLEAINPRLTFEMVRHANAEQYCIKDIFLRNEETLLEQKKMKD